jgi:hypothetical protein
MKAWVPRPFMHASPPAHGMASARATGKWRYPYAVHHVMSGCYVNIPVYCRHEARRTNHAVLLRCERSSPRMEEQLVAQLKTACVNEATEMCAVLASNRAVYVNRVGEVRASEHPPSNGPRLQDRVGPQAGSARSKETDNHDK